MPLLKSLIASQANKGKKEKSLSLGSENQYMFDAESRQNE